MPLSQVEDLADTRLAQKISQLPGVGLVSISGGQKPAVRVQVNPTALSSYGINLEDVRTALQPTSLDQAKGSFDGPHQDYQIDANDQLLTSKDFAARCRRVSQRRAGDAVGRGASDRRRGEREASGVDERHAGGDRQHPAATGRQHHPGGGPHQEAAAAAAKYLPAAVKVSILTDRTMTIRASVKDVEFELMLTVALVVMVIFLFLRSISRHDHSQRGGAAVDGRHVWRHVSAGLQPEQSDADGADDLDRLRGGRRHRDDRKHLALYRGGR